MSTAKTKTDQSTKKESIRCPELEEAVGYFRTALQQDIRRYASLSGLAVGLYHMERMPYYQTDERTHKAMEEERDRCVTSLLADSETSPEAKRCFEQYLFWVTGKRVRVERMPGDCNSEH